MQEAIDTVLYCSKCGAAIDEEDQFCQNCGRKLDIHRQCENCGQMVEEDMQFCPNCGLTLSGDTPKLEKTMKKLNSFAELLPAKKAKAAIGAAILLVAIFVLIICLNGQVNFRRAYNKIGGESRYGTWVKVGSDGKSLIIDTNPNDVEEFYDEDALVAVRKMNSALGLPDSLLSTMTDTCALDGRQTKTYDKITVSWTYHPNRGLKIIYEKR